MTQPAGQGQDQQTELLGLLDPPSLALAPTIDQRKPKDNKDERAKAWKETFRLTRREGMQTFFSALNTLSTVIGRVQIATLRKLTEADAEMMMDEGLALQTIQEALTARKEQQREIVFAAVTEKNKALGFNDPENVSGFVAVESRGKKFCKEGAGRKPAEINWDALEKDLSPEAWAQVTDRVEIPAREVSVSVTGNREKLFDYVRQNPDMVSVIYPYVTEGEPKTAKYQIRDVSDDDDGTGSVHERQ